MLEYLVVGGWDGSMVGEYYPFNYATYYCDEFCHLSPGL